MRISQRPLDRRGPPFALLVYLVSAFVSYQIEPALPSLIWLPSGVGVAAAIVLGTPGLLAVAGASIVVELAANAQPSVALVYTVGTVAEAMFALAFLRSVRFEMSMQRARDVGWLAACATLAPVLPVLGASLALGRLDEQGHALSKLWTWWAGNATGILLVVPLATSWLGAPARRSSARPFLVAIGAVLAASVVGFGAPLVGALPLAVLPYVPVMWAAAACGHRGSSLATLAFGLSAATLTGLGRGPVATLSPTERAAVLGTLVNVAALAGSLVAALATRSLRDLAALSESEERFRALAAVSPVGIYRVARSGALVYINARGVEMIGRSLEECLGNGWEQAIATSDLDALKEATSRARSTGDPIEIEFRFVHSDGREVWTLAQSIATRGPDGSLDGRIGTLTDITEQRAAQAAFESMVRGEPQADDRYSFDHLVRELAQLLGVTHALVTRALDADGRRLRVLAMRSRETLVPPIEYATKGTPSHDVAAGRAVYIEDRVLQRFPEDELLEKAGVRGYAAVPLIARDGALLGHLCVMHEGPLARTVRLERLLTVFAARASIELEREAATERLRASETRYRRIFEAAPVALAEERVGALRAEIDRVTHGGVADLAAHLEREPDFVDRAARLVDVVAANPAAVRLFGARSERDLLGPINFGASASNERTSVFREELLAIARGDRSFEAELSALTIDGRKVDMIYSVSIPPPDEPDWPMLFSARDITATKRAERGLAEARLQLRDLVAELQNVRERERSQLAREVHDELGQLLSALKMDLSWAQARLPSGSVAARGRLKAGGLLLDDTIEKVRDIATRLRPAVLDDFGLIAAMEWQVRDFQRRSELRAHFECVGSDDNVPQKVAVGAFRILQEGLTNVGRHSDGRNAWVSLSICSADVRLTVTDDGVGLRDSDAARGLGILGMRERAMALGGWVDFGRSSEGGTELSVVLPLRHPVVA